MSKFNAREFIKNGFIRDESMDFTDDGSKFKGYIYNDVEVTYCSYNGMVFISPRAMRYIKSKYPNITMYHVTNKDWYRNVDIYNGVDREEVDIKTLIDNINRFKNECENLNEELKKHIVNVNVILNRLNYEKEMLGDVLDTFKNVFDWTDDSLTEYNLVTYVDRFRFLKNKYNIICDALNEYICESRDKATAICEETTLETSGRIFISENDYYIECLREYINSRI